MEEEGSIEGDWHMFGNKDEDGALEGNGKGGVLSDIEKDGDFEGDELVLCNVVGVDIDIWEEDYVRVDMSWIWSWMFQECASADVAVSSCQP